MRKSQAIAVEQNSQCAVWCDCAVVLETTKKLTLPRFVPKYPVF